MIDGLVEDGTSDGKKSGNEFNRTFSFQFRAGTQLTRPPHVPVHGAGPG